MTQKKQESIISAKIVEDSISEQGVRLTTFKLVFPRFILPQITRHRAFSFNVSSSRGVPVKKIIQQVKEQPVVPSQFGLNQRGMVAISEVPAHLQDIAYNMWGLAGGNAIRHATILEQLGIAKEVVNRILEPFLHVQAMVSGTRWRGFFKQRISEHAQPEIRMLATRMLEALKENQPDPLIEGEWHLPYIRANEVHELTVEEQKKVSVARVARISYLKHDGTESSLEKDIGLHDFLQEQGHFSPFEHIATPHPEGSGNFHGWRQYRGELFNEDFSEDEDTELDQVFKEFQIG